MLLDTQSTLTHHHDQALMTILYPDYVYLCILRSVFPMKKLKQIISSIAAAALLLATAPAAFAANTGFTDVPNNAWYAEAVQYVTDNGLMSGTGNNQFSPNAATTRGMLMTVLARNAGTDTSNSNPWYQAGMDWAKENGVSDGTNPTGNITRAQLVTMLWRYAGSPTADAGEDFADENAIPAYAATAVDWAHANGVVNGTGGNRFDPQAGATTRRRTPARIARHLSRTTPRPAALRLLRKPSQTS